jgi:hypothetical protein
MKILVCGGRDYADVKRTKGSPDEEPLETRLKLAQYRYVHDVLNTLVMEYSTERLLDDNWLPTDITIISGCARGADSAAIDFAAVNFCKLEEYPANWEKHERLAGPIRNKQMLDEGRPDLVVAFPGGRGTANMVSQALAAGVKVIFA